MVEHAHFGRAGHTFQEIDGLAVYQARAQRSGAPRLARERRCIVPSMAYPFFTIGHSTRPIDEFVTLLTDSEVSLVVDVRTVPRSRTNPQFNRETLPASLAGHNVAYEHCPALGGLRKKQPGISPDANAFWENASFHNYADYAWSEEFRSSVEKLRALVIERA